jgi:hypothetical protein
MGKFIRTLKSKLTMKRGSCLFVDTVDGGEVFEYTDCYGQKWMAGFFHWSFRVKK